MPERGGPTMNSVPVTALTHLPPARPSVAAKSVGPDTLIRTTCSHSAVTTYLTTVPPLHSQEEEVAESADRGGQGETLEIADQLRRSRRRLLGQPEAAG